MRGYNQPKDVPAAVKRGVKLLDAVMPGWARKFPEKAFTCYGTHAYGCGVAHILQLHLDARNIYAYLYLRAEDQGVSIVSYRGGPEIAGGYYGIYTHEPVDIATEWNKILARRHYLIELRLRQKHKLTPGTRVGKRRG